MSTLIEPLPRTSETRSKRLSPRPLPPRPLPVLPRYLCCKACSTAITSVDAILLQTKTFRGFSGKASLFTKVCNTTFSPARAQLMVTGVHTMQEIKCANCTSYLGWKIVRAHDPSERWKDGNCLLELECLSDGNDSDS